MITTSRTSRSHFFILFAAGLLAGGVDHLHAADEDRGPVVSVVPCVRSDLARELSVQAEFKPYQEIELHPKVSGFLATLTVDVGDLVKEDQLIGTLEVPELGDDLARAQAMAKYSEQETSRAEASYENARLTLQRLTSVSKAQPKLIAQQDLDTATAKEREAFAALAAARAQVQVASAEVKKDQTLIQYTRITTPFTGVITRRYTDPGALIQAATTSSTQSTPLVRLSQNNKLRLVFPVSVSYVGYIKVGDPIGVELETPKRSFTAHISRFTRKVDAGTRTMDVEADVDNADLSIIPGVYATVALTLERHPRTLNVPVDSVSRGRTTTAFVVNSEGKVEERTLTLGLETPSRLEILTGLKEGDRVIVGSHTLVQAGQTVQPKPLAATEGAQ